MLEQFFDPDLWKTHYLSYFLNVLDDENLRKYNRTDFNMALQILCSLKKEAPWIFEEIEPAQLEKFADIYFNRIKKKSVTKQKQYEKQVTKFERREGFENQVLHIL